MEKKRKSHKKPSYILEFGLKKNHLYKEKKLKSLFERSRTKKSSSVFEWLFFIGLIIFILGFYFKDYFIILLVVGFGFILISLLAIRIDFKPEEHKIKIKPKKEHKPKIKHKKFRFYFKFPKFKFPKIKRKRKIEHKTKIKKVRLVQSRKIVPKSKKTNKRPLISIILMIFIVLAILFIIKFINYKLVLLIILLTFVIVLITRIIKNKSKTKQVKISQIKASSEPRIRIIHQTIRPLKKSETELDLVLELVEKNGSIPLAYVARKFGIKPEKAEEWAKILESHGLIKVYYPAIGAPILKSIKNSHKPNGET